MSQSLRALVTGGGGFLGSRIVALLLRQGWTVTSFSRGQYPELAARGVSCIAGDLADAGAVLKAAQDADVVFHAAAKAGLWGDYKDYYAANVTGTGNVIEACRRNGIRKLVYTSTPSLVFGGGHVRNGDESLPIPRKHLNHYAGTKAQAERLVLDANGPDLATVALRPHVIWGPGDNQVFPRIVARHRAGRLMLVGNGNNLVDTVFVDNAAQAHLDAAERLAPGSAIAGRAYFITQGEPRPIRSILNDLLETVGMPPVTRSVPVPVARVAACLLETVYRVLGVAQEPPITPYFVLLMARDHYFDISAARRDLGYRPAVSTAEGMQMLRSALIAAREQEPSPVER